MYHKPRLACKTGTAADTTAKKRSLREITERYISRLEAMIRETPELWMWSHRRWKHKKPADYDITHSEKETEAR